MDPWTALGWILLAIVVVVVVVRLAMLVLLLWAAWAKGEPKRKAARKRKAAMKGKVTCDFLAWENEPLPGQDDVPYYLRKTDRVRVTCARVATHYTKGYWTHYRCEEHAARKHLPGDNTYAHPLISRPRPEPKTRVIT